VGGRSPGLFVTPQTLVRQLDLSTPQMGHF